MLKKKTNTILSS